MDMQAIMDYMIGLVLLWSGSIEYRMRWSKRETVNLIDLKMEATKAIQIKIAEDVIRLESKIDKIMDVVIRLKTG